MAQLLGKAQRALEALVLIYDRGALTRGRDLIAVLEQDSGDALEAYRETDRGYLLAEEFADVMIYGLQIMTVLGVDVSEQILRKLDIVRKRPPQC